jgi:hypothetical protein
MNQTGVPKVIGLVVCLIIAASSVTRLGADKRPTDTLADGSDAVVLAEIRSGQQSGNVATFFLSIQRTLKGSLAVGTVISVSGRSSVSGNRSLGGQYGLWFLKNTVGQWGLMPVIAGGATLESSGYVPLPKTGSDAAVSVASSSDTVSDQIAGALVSALEGYTDARQLYPIALQLSRIGTSAKLPGFYRTLRAKPDPQLKFIGLAGSLGGDDEISAVLEIANSADLLPTLRTRSLLETAVSGMHNPDRRVVLALGKFAGSADRALQRSAAMALENIHSRDTLPFLVQLLDSADSMARETALSGLSRFVDNLPIHTDQDTVNGTALRPQGTTPYRTPETDKYSLSRRQLGLANEAEYIQFWKSWWARMKDQITAQP